MDSTRRRSTFFGDSRNSSRNISRNFSFRRSGGGRSRSFSNASSNFDQSTSGQLSRVGSKQFVDDEVPPEERSEAMKSSKNSTANETSEFMKVKDAGES